MPLQATRAYAPLPVRARGVSDTRPDAKRGDVRSPGDKRAGREQSSVTRGLPRPAASQVDSDIPVLLGICDGCCVPVEVAIVDPPSESKAV